MITHGSQRPFIELASRHKAGTEQCAECFAGAGGEGPGKGEEAEDVFIPFFT